MIRIELQVDLNYEVDGGGADFVFNIHAANTPHQTVSGERLTLSQAVPQRMHTDPATGNRYLHVRADPGEMKLSYSATVDLVHYIGDPTQIAEVPVREIPPEVMGYIYPSRYCQSDRLIRLATRNFGRLGQGYSRVLAIRDWVNRHVTFTPNSSNSNTSAVDTLIEEVGVPNERGSHRAAIHTVFRRSALQLRLEVIV